MIVSFWYLFTGTIICIVDGFTSSLFPGRISGVPARPRLQCTRSGSMDGRHTEKYAEEINILRLWPCHSNRQ